NPHGVLLRFNGCSGFFGVRCEAPLWFVAPQSNQSGASHRTPKPRKPVPNPSSILAFHRLADAVQVIQRPHEDLPATDRGGSLALLVEVITAEALERRPGFQHKHLPGVVQEIETPLRRYRRGAVVLPQPLRPEPLARPRLQAAGHALVGNNE